MPTKYDPDYYRAHRDAHRAKQRRYEERHRDSVRDRRKVAREAVKDVANAKIRAYYRQDPRRKFVIHIKNRYGLTIEQYESMKISQHNACAICGQVKKLLVDHDHTTGQVRGMLCAGCNSGLGHYERPGWPEMADAYLARDRTYPIAALKSR